MAAYTDRVTVIREFNTLGDLMWQFRTCACAKHLLGYNSKKSWYCGTCKIVLDPPATWWPGFIWDHVEGWFGGDVGTCCKRGHPYAEHTLAEIAATYDPPRDPDELFKALLGSGGHKDLFRVMTGLYPVEFDEDGNVEVLEEKGDE